LAEALVIAARLQLRCADCLGLSSGADRPRSF